MVPLISVIVCVHNEELYLERCIRSLLSQVFSANFEIIIVDDGSTDSSVEIIKKYMRLRKVRAVFRSQQGGIGAAARDGVESSMGRFVVRVDADDYVSEHLLQVLWLALVEPSEARAARCDYLLVDTNGSIIERKDAREFPIACGILFDRDALAQIGNYNLHLTLGEDVELERRFTEQFLIAHVPIALYRYRRHTGNSTKAGS